MKYYMLGMAALLLSAARRKSGQFSSLPTVRGVIETTHSLPGRLRVRVPSLIGNPGIADMLRGKMAGLTPVESIQVNTVSGSVLVRFDETEAEPIVIFGAIVHILDLDHGMGAGRDAVLWRELKYVSRAVNDAIYNASMGILDLKTLVVLGLTSAVTYRVATGATRLALPGTATLGWWIYRHLFFGGPR